MSQSTYNVAVVIILLLVIALYKMYGLQCFKRHPLVMHSIKIILSDLDLGGNSLLVVKQAFIVRSEAFQYNGNEGNCLRDRYKEFSVIFGYFCTKK